MSERRSGGLSECCRGHAPPVCNVNRGNRATGGDRECGLVGLDWFIMLPVFVGLLLALVALPQWPERQGAARGAAAEAARAAVLVDRPDQVADAAEHTARQVLANYGIAPADAAISVAGALDRGTAIVVSVTIRMPVIAVPFGPALATSDYTATSSERVEDYRSIDR
jgi:Flp pilus assembly protein TadG